MGGHVCSHYLEYIHPGWSSDLVIGKYREALAIPSDEQGANTTQVGLVIGGRILLGFGSTGRIGKNPCDCDADDQSSKAPNRNSMLIGLPDPISLSYMA